VEKVFQFFFNIIIILTTKKLFLLGMKKLFLLGMFGEHRWNKKKPKITNNRDLKEMIPNPND
jgi:hypothetical protein